jgi:hypothetical protein
MLVLKAARTLLNLSDLVEKFVAIKSEKGLVCIRGLIGSGN